MAQDSGSPTDSLDFLHSIYTRKVGPGNPIGARILSRFIANLAYSLGEEEHVGIRMVIRNSEDESEVASPQLLRGETLPWNAVGLMQPEGFR